MTRRTFLESAAAVGAAAGAASSAWAAAPPKVIDCHAHFQIRGAPGRGGAADGDRLLIEAADKLGIDLLCCSLLTARRPAAAEQFREANQHAWEAVKRFPGRVLAYAYVNPGYTKEAVDEVRRCVEDRGFMGVKVYNEYWATEPVFYPLIEAIIQLRVPILFHAGHMHFYNEQQPRISDGGHIAELARRYPEAMMICGHVCGGGDWEWTIKSLRNAPSVYLDTSGSVVDEGVIEMCVDVLGADRVLFGCDMSMTAGVVKIRAAQLSAADRAKILGGNMKSILAKRGTRA